MFLFLVVPTKHSFMFQAMNFMGVYEIFTNVYEKLTPPSDQSDYRICYDYDFMFGVIA